MKRIRIIMRADDCGSTKGANEAIFRAVGRPYIKNISIMAAGPRVKEAASVLAGRRDLCFGLHFTMNSEWDRVKWRPVLPGDRISSLLTAEGEFYPEPACYGKVKPAIEEIEREWRAQLDRLCSLGFAIRYADTHMFPERFIPGLKEAMSGWIREKGLVDHRYFYQALPRMDELAKQEGLLEKTLAGLKDGQYFYLLHPALDTPDMRLCYNSTVNAGTLIQDRGQDLLMAVSEETGRIFRTYEAETIRYDEADEKEGDVDSLEKWLGGRKK